MNRYFVLRQEVIQASWAMHSMLGDKRRKFSDDQNVEIAKTLKDLHQVMTTGSSAGTRFE